ncbi:MAG: hypothetical protein LBP76_02395 [Treponema sp.]|jgi:hypothetical protein|nr:hypothetical protein [Treponema sp.]
MKTKTAFLKPLPVLILAAICVLAACDNGSTGDGGELGYNDTPVTSFAGTRWSDDLLPESTITFDTAASLTLEGRYWQQTQPGTLAGPHSYEAADDLGAAAVEPAIWILVDSGNRVGLEVLYYKADPDTGKHQRLVVWRPGLLQPREFYLH